jgi:uncharacterized protein involved in response to NO
MSIDPQQKAASRFVLFAYGFRPFFLLAGWFALLAIGGWLWVFSSPDASFTVWPASYGPVQLWHGHEMLFGFVAAAIAGFLLTAVPSWTGSKGFGGWPLVVLTLVWILGRLVFLSADNVSFYLLAFIELSFLPALAVLIAPPLLRARNRNTPLLLVLLFLWVCDATFLRAVYLGTPEAASSALLATINILMVLITVIGGRIVPAFTANALRKRNPDLQLRNNKMLDGVVIALMVGVVAIDALFPRGFLAGGLAAAAGLAQLWRLAGWKGLHTLRDPIVWVLHIGYAWLPIGLLLKTGFLLAGFEWAAFWQHALAAGAAATMILGVMSRASLGHTGRPLEVAPAMAWSYAVLSLAVLTRVFGPALLPVSYGMTIKLAGLLWVVAFLLFVVVYTPVLLTPRLDGKPG